MMALPVSVQFAQIQFQLQAFANAPLGSTKHEPFMRKAIARRSARVRGISQRRACRRSRPSSGSGRHIIPPEWCLLDPVSRQLQPVSYDQGQDACVNHRIEIPVTGVGTYFIGMWTNLVCYEENDNLLGDVDQALAALGDQKIYQKCPFLTLPAEILWRVFDELEVDDIVVLSSTCRIMFKLVSTTIARDIRKTSGLRAKKPLSVVARDTHSLPGPLLLDGMIFDTVSCSKLAPSCFRNTGRSLTDFLMAIRHFMSAVQTSYERVQPYASRPRSELHYIDCNRKASSWGTSSRTLRSRADTRRTNPCHRILHRLLTRDNQPCIFDDPLSGSLYYLRNHTTHNLVRVCNCRNPYISAHLNDSPDMKDDLKSTLNPDIFLTSPTLDDVFVMMTRLCDPATTSTSPIAQGTWTTGPWSGHSFDIVSARRHLREYPSYTPLIRQGTAPASSTKCNTTPIAATAIPTSKFETKTSIQWHDVTTAVLTRAHWEHDRLRGCDHIASIGKPDHRKRKGPRGTLAARRHSCNLWRSYMDSVYHDITGLFDGDDDREKGIELVKGWRRKLDVIVGKCEEAILPGGEMELLVRGSEKEGDDVMGWKRQRQRVSVRRSERLAARKGVRGM